MRRLALLAALFALIAGPAAAQDDAEVIHNYASNIAVHPDGTLTVRETIDITAAGIRIRHGIYRDFPTTYTDKLGRRVRVRFDVSSVTRDGQPEPYSEESLSNGVRVKIGSADTYVPQGGHVYTISYTTDRQIGFFEKYDEIYWNVTGNGWIFPIEHAEATIVLPTAARIAQYAFYTGPEGAHGKDARGEVIDDHTIRFETTAALGSEEGLTVAVGFSKGVVTPPTAAEETASFFADNAPTIISVVGLVALFAYYLVAWWSFGRDPSLGTIIPLFAAPKGFSAAAVRYVRHMAYDRKAFAAALISMAVKGYMKIHESDGEYTLERTGKSPGDAGLANGENAIANALFASRDKIVLKQSNHSAVARAISGLKTALSSEYEKSYFVTNIGWFIGGIVILGLTGLAAAMLSDDPASAGFMLVWLSGWSVGTSFLVHSASSAWYTVIAGPGSRILNFFSAAFTSLFALPFVGGLIAVLVVFGTVISLPAMLGLVLGGILAYVFYHLLKAPTAAGAKTLAEIEGFRIFLDTAEKDRLEKLNPPEITPEVFERFLPYAIALDCENRWSKRFEAEAAAAAAADPARASAYAYQPSWYSGSSFSRLGTAGFVSAIGSSVASAAASASTAPGSSSGSGGGGSSGGGGGGGGGGGW